MSKHIPFKIRKKLDTNLRLMKSKYINKAENPLFRPREKNLSIEELYKNEPKIIVLYFKNKSYDSVSGKLYNHCKNVTEGDTNIIIYESESSEIMQLSFTQNSSKYYVTFSDLKIELFFNDDNDNIVYDFGFLEDILIYFRELFILTIEELYETFPPKIIIHIEEGDNKEQFILTSNERKDNSNSITYGNNSYIFEISFKLPNIDENRFDTEYFVTINNSSMLKFYLNGNIYKNESGDRSIYFTIHE